MFLLPNEVLFAWRHVLILWTTALVAPIEPVFDAVEDELVARGHHMRNIQS